MDPALAAQLAGFREARRELEASVLPLATSVDGRRFSFQASLYGLQVQVGGYVVLGDGDGTRLGQVITLDLDRLSTELVLPASADGVPGNRSQVLIRYARGEGVILEGNFAPFHDVTVRPATGAEVRAWLGRTAAPGAKLRLGELALASGVPCAAELDPATQAAVLRLDPIADREEYAELSGLLAGHPDRSAVEELSVSDSPEARRLGLRAGNLGIDRFTVWAPGEVGSVLDAVHDQDARCVVIDLGSLPTREEQSLIAAAVLGDLWQRRHERKPVLIVIDEAHNVCPADPPDQLIAQAAEHTIRIAAEGRKFGLYLLVSTQRPQKIAENVLTQADNLVLMRLNSLADTAFTQEVFSFVPPSLIDRAVTFHQGEALIAGKISPQPALLRFGARISEEGGADVPATWAEVH